MNLDTFCDSWYSNVILYFVNNFPSFNIFQGNRIPQTSWACPSVASEIATTLLGQWTATRPSKNSSCLTGNCLQELLMVNSSWCSHSSSRIQRGPPEGWVEKLPLNGFEFTRNMNSGEFSFTGISWEKNMPDFGYLFAHFHFGLEMKGPHKVFVTFYMILLI